MLCSEWNSDLWRQSESVSTTFTTTCNIQCFLSLIVYTLLYLLIVSEIDPIVVVCVCVQKRIRRSGGASELRFGESINA